MYTILDYGWFIADEVRMRANVAALRQAVGPGSVVLDVGTGTGIFALLACRFGARRVYALEPHDLIHVAREAAAANGYAERIEFIQDVSTRVSLPERADVMISDIRGVLPLFDGHIPAVIDARARLLVPGATLIPRRDTLWVAVVDAPALYRHHAGPWEEQHYGLEMRAARRVAVNTWSRGRVEPGQLLVEPRCWATLDYATVATPDVSGEVTWTAARAGTAHGVDVWFDAVLGDGAGFSNAPGQPELIYRSAFFPWTWPVPLAVGDSVSVTLHADLVGQDYVWRWRTRVLGQGDPGRVKADFAQSSFFGEPVTPARLGRLQASHVPKLSQDGEVARVVLELMGQGTALGDIARQVAARFPDRFARWQDALTRVGELSSRYAR